MRTDILISPQACPACHTYVRETERRNSNPRHADYDSPRRSDWKALRGRSAPEGTPLLNRASLITAALPRTSPQKPASKRH